MRALVCGAGIGGLTTALTLAEAGVEVVVFESALEIRALGVGINLLPHAVRVLTGLGRAAALERTGIATGELEYYTKQGKLTERSLRRLPLASVFDSSRPLVAVALAGGARA